MRQRARRSHPEAVPTETGRRSALRRGVGALVRWVGAALLCRTPLLAWWVSGWLLRRAEASAWRRLHRLAGHRGEEPRADGWWSRATDAARLGVTALATTWLLTGPGAVLWWFGWRYGWDNSFLKGYESAAIGPLTSLLGVAMFTAAMLVVPMGQARLAVTRSWRAAVDVSFLWRLVRRQWPGGVLLGAGYAAVGLVVMVMWVSVTMSPVQRPEMAAWSHAEATEWLGRHYVFFALLCVPLLVALRRTAGWWYASALVATVRSGELGPSGLHPVEADALRSLGLLSVRDHPNRHRLWRFARWSATRIGRTTGTVLMVALWLVVVAQVFVGQFFHYRSGRGWVNVPAIHMPWLG